MCPLLCRVGFKVWPLAFQDELVNLTIAAALGSSSSRSLLITLCSAIYCLLRWFGRLDHRCCPRIITIIKIITDKLRRWILVCGIWLFLLSLKHHHHLSCHPLPKLLCSKELLALSWVLANVVLISDQLLNLILKWLSFSIQKSTLNFALWQPFLRIREELTLCYLFFLSKVIFLHSNLYLPFLSWHLLSFLWRGGGGAGWILSSSLILAFFIPFLTMGAALVLGG